MTLSKKFTLIDLFNPIDIDLDSGVQQLTSIEIPAIQRDYAQGRDLPDVNRIRKRFLDSLYVALVSRPIVLDFVYGDINSQGKLIPLDGQQRLTTLFLLHWYIARHENIQEDEMAFLAHFSYSTRYSAREFYRNLVNYTPDFKEEKLSNDIIDQSWMPIEWQYDPTIRSMLNMLDAIHEKFKGSRNLWEKLKCGAISFYFLPIKDMGLTDELYIKMNSRGKPLTEFEHFKAEWERRIQDIDPQLRNNISRKIDTEWTDIFWPLHDESGIVDNEFVRYFRFLCDVARFKTGWRGSKAGKAEDLLDLTEQMFGQDNPNALDNIKWIEKGLDCWKGVNIIDLFSRHLTMTGHMTGKSFIKNIPSLNLFENCCHEYGDWLSAHNRKFPLPRMVYLYAFVFYLLNRDEISDFEFSRRLRIVVNLVKASEFDLRDDGMKDVFRQVDRILSTGEVENSADAGGFNLNQRIEEHNKIAWLNDHPEDAEAMFKLEDHQLMYGAVRAIGFEHINFVDRFYSLFSCDYALIDRALLTIGDYSMRVRGRYMFGSVKDTTWRQLFRNKEESIGRTRDALVTLLGKGETFDNTKLEGIVNQYLNTLGLFDWRRYLIKYETMHPKGYGMYLWNNGGAEKKSYEIIAMYTEKNLSGRNWNVFLRALYEKIKLARKTAEFEFRLGEYAYAHDGDKLELVFNSKLLSFGEHSIKLYERVQGLDGASDAINEVESVEIPQQDGVDKEDRVELAYQKIMGMVES